MRRSTRGFTLIELLVVIAIIAILAAILFPVFAKVKVKAQQVTCMNNMRQINRAIITYADDYSGVLPPLKMYTINLDTGGPGTPTYNPSVKNVPGVLVKYLKNTKLLVCPNDARLRPGQPKPYYSYPMNGGITWAGYQGVFDNNQRGKCDQTGMSVSAFSKPSRMIMLIDESCDKRDYAIDINDEVIINQDRTGNAHNGRANVTFLDGHSGQVPGMIQWDSPNAKWPDGSWMFFERKLH